MSIFNNEITDNKHSEYLYKRGYLITDKDVTVNQNWKKYTIAASHPIYLYTDTKNEVAYARHDDCWALILGTAMDTVSYHMNLEKIAKKIADLYSLDEIKMLDYIDYLNGRHIIMYGNNTETFLLNDATGMRTVYYATNRLFIASHYNLINDFVNDMTHPYMEKYLNYSPLPWTLPGDITPLLHIKALIPNHKLNLKEMSISRFWPRAPHEDLSPDFVYNYIAKNIQEQINTLTSYRKCCISLTKGNDSRITLAAAKEKKDSILFFSHAADNTSRYKTDAVFAKKIADEYGLNHFELDLVIPKEDLSDYVQLEKIIQHNHYHKYDQRCAYSYLKFFRDDYIHIRSNLIEIIREFEPFSVISNDVTPKDFATVCSKCYTNDLDAISLFQDYFVDQEYANLFNYSMSNVLYWEYRMGVWLNSGVLLQDDLSFDTYMLFNCRKILEYGLSVPEFFIKGNYVVRECVERLWPQLWNYIPNTDYTSLDYIPMALNNFMEIKKGEVVSGCINNKTEPQFIARLGRTSGIIGFANAKVFQGQYIDYTANLPVCKGMHVIQAQVFVSTKNNFTKNFGAYEVYIDDEKCYYCEFSRFQDKINQINIIHNFTEHSEKTIKIRLLAHSDYYANTGAAGVIEIVSISINRQDNYPITSRTAVVSTVETLNNTVETLNTY